MDYRQEALEKLEKEYKDKPKEQKAKAVMPAALRAYCERVPESLPGIY